MTLNDLINLIPEAKRNLPLCVLDPNSGYVFQVVEVEVENNEYISSKLISSRKMSEATKNGEHILIDFTRK